MTTKPEEIIEAEFVENKPKQGVAVQLTETEQLAIEVVNFPQRFAGELLGRAMKALPRAEKILPREKLNPSGAVDSIVDVFTRVANRGAPPPRNPPPGPSSSSSSTPAPAATSTPAAAPAADKDRSRPYRSRNREEK